jgi:hypothetical protein
VVASEATAPEISTDQRGADGRTEFVTLTEDLEQQLGVGRRQRHIAEFVKISSR